MKYDRRKKNGMDYNDFLPTALKGNGGSVEGKENIPAHKPAAPLRSDTSESTPVDSSAQAAPAVEAPQQLPSNGASSTYQQSASNSSASNAPPAPKSPRAAAPGWAGGQGSRFGGAGGAGGVGEQPRPGVPKVKKMPSVLSRWPPAQNND